MIREITIKESGNLVGNKTNHKIGCPYAFCSCDVFCAWFSIKEINKDHTKQTFSAYCKKYEIGEIIKDERE